MKPERRPKLVSVNLDVLRFSEHVDRPAQVRCLNCSTALTLHQPDLNVPERLLGTCEKCKHWFLVDILPTTAEGVLLRLPDVQVIRDLTQADSSGGVSLTGQDTE
jgi:hypothetical protein